MTFFDLIRARRSTREFLTKDVDAPALARVLDAANRAPSAGNLQAYGVVVVRDADRRRRLSEAALGQAWIARAPVVFVFLAVPERSKERYGGRGAEVYALQDATIAAAHAQLAAHALGLGTVWVGAFEDDAVRDALAAPREVRPTSLLVMGHPAEPPTPSERRALSDLARRETWNGAGW